MTPPRPGTAVRMYVDGASRGNPGKAGAGVVFVDPTTGAVVGRAGKYLGTATNNVAEYEGLLLGLEIARARGLRVVEVIADSQLLVRQLTGAYKVTKPHLQTLHARATGLLAALGMPPVTHTLRAGNTLADEMSNRAIDERMRGADDVEWAPDAPAPPRPPAPRAEARPATGSPDELQATIVGFTEVLGLRLRNDPDRGAGALLLDLARGRAHGSPAIRLEFGDVRDLELHRFGGAAQLGLLTVDDIRARRLDGIRYEVADRAQGRIAFVCGSARLLGRYSVGDDVP